MIEFIQRLLSDAACRSFFGGRRWPDGPVCPKYGSVSDLDNVPLGFRRLIA
ncbi:transposase [Salipiger sp. PrR003]|uniref:transposase n=1 Tax=Salipiger sp. PrR003 TaxID=2706776 RepID=UPI0013DB0F0D|nr:transposase [Salipiger sp. PrR003]